MAMLGTCLLSQMVIYLASMGPQCINLIGTNIGGFKDSSAMKKVSSASHYFYFISHTQPWIILLYFVDSLFLLFASYLSESMALPSDRFGEQSS